jgi:hypothetical protein
MNDSTDDKAKQPLIYKPQHLKAKLMVGLLLLVLSFIGMIITDFAPGSAWRYWSIMLPFFAIICLWLSWLDSDKKHKLDGVTIGHEILHWLALLATVYMVVIFTQLGIMSNIVAGLFILTLLALATFLAGVYIDLTFMIIGVLLGLFAIISAMFIKYLFVITIPLCVIVIVLLYLLYKHGHKMKEG